MKRVLSLLVILFCFLITFPAWAATYTINNSTVTQTTGFTPSGTLAGGDTLLLPASIASVGFEYVTGASGSPITIKNPSDSKATIDSVSQSVVSLSFKYCRYIIVDGSNYAAETYGIELSNGYFGIRIMGSSDIEINNIELHDTLHQGILWQDGTWTATKDVENIKIHHSYIHDIGREAIYLGNSSFDPDEHPSFKDCKIYSNTIEDCGWDCIQLGAADQGTNDVYKNYCKNCGTTGTIYQNTGIIFNASSTGNIYQNMVINAYAQGIRINGSVGLTDIHDNVVVDSGGYGIHNDSNTNGQKITNNTVVNRDTSVVNYQGIVTSVGGDFGEIRYNLVVGTGKAGTISTSYSTNQDNVTSNSITDMYFADASVGNFQLTTQSPAKDYSSNPGYSNTDYDNNTRPYKETPADAGAYEYAPIQTVQNLRILQ